MFTLSILLLLHTLQKSGGYWTVWKSLNRRRKERGVGVMIIPLAAGDTAQDTGHSSITGRRRPDHSRSFPLNSRHDSGFLIPGMFGNCRLLSHVCTVLKKPETPERQQPAHGYIASPEVIACKMSEKSSGEAVNNKVWYS